MHMPYSIGQWTGVIVTAIVVLGCDADVAYAMPLGIMAGALAIFFVTLGEGLQRQAELKPSRAVSSRVRPRVP
jgi:hypothetical protein